MSKKLPYKFRHHDMYGMKTISVIRFTDGKPSYIETTDGFHGDFMLGECGSHIMQSTGLTDKNGKEIYEGDFILVIENRGTHTTGYWPNGDRIDQVNRWTTDTIEVVEIDPSSMVMLEAHVRLRDVEILGNIYEHKVRYAMLTGK